MTKKSLMNGKEVKRILRAGEYLLRWLFLEYPRGLDFSLRVKFPSGNKDSMNGYARTSKSALENLIKNLSVEDKKVLDIGSGKGSVIADFYVLGFSESHGIEYNEMLHNIAQKNISVLRIDKFCKSYNLDARKFEYYARYDVYFLFNPFNENLYAEVMAVLRNQIRGSNLTRYIIAYGNANHKAIKSIENCALKEAGICPHRKTNYSIYKIN